MASSFDGYRSPVPSQAPPPPVYRDQDPQNYNSPNPVTSPVPLQQQDHHHDNRPRAGSTRSDGPPDPSRYIPSAKATAPLNEAVSSAFDHAHPQTYGMPPDIVAQITEDVIKRLKTAGFENKYAPPGTQSQQQPVRTPSGSTSPSMPNRPVYTPPSPHLRPEVSSTSYGSPEQSYMPTFAPPQSQSPRESRSPRQDQNGFSEQYQQQRAASPHQHRASSPHHQTAASPHQQRAASPVKASSVTEDRPALKPQNSRMFFYGDIEPTTLDKIWGPLFDPEGKATPRLGQLLRGLAHHIIECFEPEHTLVVTPRKMAKFYDRFKVSNEPYDWAKFFETHPEDLSDIYCDLECQHHFVQRLNRHSQTPYIPGLTPIGFAKWMTIRLMAHPEEEVERLQKAIVDLPIDNPDALKEQERFPKEVSRHLFLKKADQHELKRFRDAVKFDDDDDDDDHSRVRSRDKDRDKDSSQPSQRFRDHAKSMPAAVPISIPRAASIERERQPYSSTPNEHKPDEHREPPPPVAIERERKPYSAQPGGGRTYEEGKPVPTPATSTSDTTSSSSRPQPQLQPKLARSNSATKSDHSTASHPPPEPRHHRTGSNATSGHNAPQMRRPRSPGGFSAGGDSSGGFRRSDNDVSTSAIESEDEQGHYRRPRAGTGSTRDSRDMSYLAEQKQRNDWARRQAEDEAREHRDRERERDKFGHGPPEVVGSPPSKRGGDYAEEFYRAGGAGGARQTGTGYDYRETFPPGYR